MVKVAWVLEPDCVGSNLSPDTCVNLRSLLYASIPQFSHLKSGDGIFFSFFLKIKYANIN